MKNLFLPIFAILAAVAPLAEASFTLNTEFATLFQSNGSTEIGPGKIGILVADEGGSGIVNPFNTTLAVGNVLGGAGSDDRIVALFTSIPDVGGTGKSGFSGVTTFNYAGNFGVGDNLYLLWFPTLTTVGSTVADGVSFGQYRSTTPNTASGSDIGFVVPTDGTYNLFAYLGTLPAGSGSPVTAADFTASKLTVVPEPSVSTLLALGVLAGLIAGKSFRPARPLLARAVANPRG